MATPDPGGLISLAHRYSPLTGLALLLGLVPRSGLNPQSPRVMAAKQVSTGPNGFHAGTSAPDSGMHRRQDELDTGNLIVPAPVNHSTL